MMYDILMGTSDLRFLWLLSETSGATAADASGNSRTGTYNGVTLNQYRPGWKTIKDNAYLMKMVSFDGVNDKIDGAAGCSVRGLGAATFIFVLEVTALGAARVIWYESVAAVSGGAGRVYLEIQADNTMSLVCRSGTSAQAGSTITTDSALAAGIYMLHATVDIPNDAMQFFVNGAVVASTGVPDFGVDTVFADTAPDAGPRMGSYQASVWYNGKAAYVGQWSRVLTATEILSHAKAGGFA